MSGILYLCATPIGNLEDMTFRAVRTLQEVDLIAAEDTRNSIKLLNHYEIKTPMTSYHEYNRIEKAHRLTEQLKQGKNIALITDAGMPAISDPGEDLVRICYEAGIRVEIVPGACACVSALALSALSTRRFCFEGFLPADKAKRKQLLEYLPEETRTIILYEAPHHLRKTLAQLQEALGNRRITLCKELTKKHETVFATTLEEARHYYEKEAPRGEYVLVIEGRSIKELEQEEKLEWQKLDAAEHVALYEKQGISRKEAMKRVAKDRGVSKREIYQELLEASEDLCQ